MAIGFKQNSDGSWYSYKIEKTEKPLAETKKEKFTAMSDGDLRNYASENSIPIPGNVSKRETIISIILQHEQNK